VNNDNEKKTDDEGLFDNNSSAPKLQTSGSNKKPPYLPKTAVGSNDEGSYFNHRAHLLGTNSDLTESQQSGTDMAFAALKLLTRPIEENDGVIGSFVVGLDRVLLTSMTKIDFDFKSFCESAVNIFETTRNLLVLTNGSSLRQLIACMSTGYVLITDFGSGLLITLCEQGTVFPNSILQIITSLVRDL
jgi:predicted regulator of Ras-like GTPase activity (Roadblock/LC7/MglB family)